MKNTGELAYQCCFCGESIRQNAHDPVHIEISLENDTTQGITAHGKCLRRALHPSVPTLIGSDDDENR